MEKGRFYAAFLMLFMALDKVSLSGSNSFLDDEDIDGSSGYGLGDKENGNITMSCTNNTDRSCSDDATWRACLSRMSENKPDCIEYKYYTMQDIQHNCNTTQTSCALSMTIVQASRSKNDTTWQCSSSEYDFDSISPSSDISVDFSPRPSVDVESNIRIVKALHQPVTLSICVLAHPPPVFTWFSKRDSTEWIETTDGIVSDDKHSHLFIEKLGQDDFGQYKVEIRNNIKPDYVQFFTIQEGDDKQKPGHSIGEVVGAGCGGLATGILAMLLVLLICKFKRHRKGRDVRSYETTAGQVAGHGSRAYDTARPEVTKGRNAKSAGDQLEMETYENADLVQGNCGNLQRDGTSKEPPRRSKVLSCNGEEIYDEVL